MGPTSDCYPALREDKRKLRFAQSRSAAGGPRVPLEASRGPRDLPTGSGKAGGSILTEYRIKSPHGKPIQAIPDPNLDVCRI